MTRYRRVSTRAMQQVVPIYADEMISLESLVISVETLNGEIIDLLGRIRKQNGETAVGAKDRVLVAPQH
jgi:hypothetical protein